MFDRRMAAEDGFNLRQLDTIPAQLDLVIEAAHEFQFVRTKGADEVSGPEGHRSRLGGQGIGYKAVGSQLGPLKVARAYAGAANVEFTRDARGNRPAGLVRNIKSGVGDRRSQGDNTRLSSSRRIEPE